MFDALFRRSIAAKALAFRNNKLNYNYFGKKTEEL